VDLHAKDARIESPKDKFEEKLECWIFFLKGLSENQSKGEFANPISYSNVLKNTDY